MFCDHVDFYRLTGGTPTKILQAQATKRLRHTVSLAPLKSVAVSAFSFPFSNALRIREALKLQTLPYAAAGGMELFPSVLEKSARNSRGVVWYIPAAELENTPLPATSVENRVWPAPLPLVSKIGGDGVTLWTDEENTCSILWREGAPVLYRWKARGKTSLDAERTWYEAYCRSKEEEPGAFFALDATLPSEAVLLPEIIRQSVSRYPWIAGVDLSRSALDSALVLDRTVRSGTRAAGWLLALGLLISVGNGLRYTATQRNIDILLDRSFELYRREIDPSQQARVRNTVELARRKLGEIQGKPVEGRLIHEVLSDMGDIFERYPDMEVTLHSVRYNLNEINCTVSAPSMAAIQSFQKAWEEKAASASWSNMVNAPGIGYRFDLKVNW